MNLETREGEKPVDDWGYLLSFLPEEFEEQARTLGAFARPREVRDPSSLLRLVLAYVAGTEPSLRQTATWAQSEGVATLSAVAVRQRLRRSSAWLAWLVSTLLRTGYETEGLPARSGRLRLIDASVLTVPGSTGTDYRLHLGFDLLTLSMDHLELTDGSGGESLSRFTFEAGEWVLMDRCYPHRAGLMRIRQAGAHFVGRFRWNGLSLVHSDGTPFDLFEHLRRLSNDEVGDWSLEMAEDPKERTEDPAQGDRPERTVRVIALRKSPEATQKAVQKLRRAARKKGRTPDPRSLEAAGYVFLVTSLDRDTLSATEALALYRLRWQIELYFKRLKSLFHLDALPCKDPLSVKAFLLAKLLLAQLVRRLQEAGGFSPWGYGRAGGAGVAMAVGSLAGGGGPVGGPGVPVLGCGRDQPSHVRAAPPRRPSPSPQPTPPIPLSVLPA